jgi:ergothioneine biosynthesis protein EgtB
MEDPSRMTPVSAAPATELQPSAVSSKRDERHEGSRDGLLQQFCSIRGQSLELCAPLTAEDMMVQSCPEASPAKWHLAHTTWFYETFILREFLPGYREYDHNYLWLFNSYYNGVSERPEKKLRATFSRPALDGVLNYRRHVDEAIERLCSTELAAAAEERLILGLHHEQQHIELLATDIKHSFWSNPLHPAYKAAPLAASREAEAMEWIEYPGGIHEIGHGGDGFAFDMESPRHKQYLEPFRLASRPVSCAEFLDFINCGGYERAELWLSEGWETVRAQGWRAPLYWHAEAPGDWKIFTLRGWTPIQEIAATPVCHVSYFEADAFANWAGKRLPTEAEWEVAATPLPVEGNFLEGGRLHPAADENSLAIVTNDVTNGKRPSQMFGDVWEWTRSPFVGYPGFKPAAGAIGEYNGKFMCNQMVLRGGSIVTPGSHLRASYRNFFPAATRWQFSGIRLSD